MSLTTIAVVILGLWVVAIAIAGLVMTLRPGGVGVKLAPGVGAPVASSDSRQEIPLGGEAQVLGNFRGRVAAILLSPESRQLAGLELGRGLLEGEVVPADAIIGADGNAVSLLDGWQDRSPEETTTTATLKQNTPVVREDGKRLGRLRLVCYEPASKTATALVVEGGAENRRLVPIERVLEVGPDRIRTNVAAADAARLEVFATDWELRQAILERLGTDPEFDGLSRSLQIEVRSQRVHLQGYVADRRRAERVQEAIRGVPGVQTLDSELRSDDQLAQAVRDALARDPSASKARIDITVFGGVVDITGEAPDRTTLRRIDAVTQQIEGAQIVHNMVVVPVRQVPSPAS